MAGMTNKSFYDGLNVGKENFFYSDNEDGQYLEKADRFREESRKIQYSSDGHAVKAVKIKELKEAFIFTAVLKMKQFIDNPAFGQYDSVEASKTFYMVVNIIAASGDLNVYLEEIGEFSKILMARFPDIKFTAFK